MNFDALRIERREIRGFVQLHEASVLEFVGDGVRTVAGKPDYSACSWFRLTADEVWDDDQVRPPHLSTSASCLESLADSRIGTRGGLTGDRAELARRFSARALRAKPSRWRSEGAADVYCRARTLPAVLRFHGPWSRAQRDKARQLLEEIFAVVDTDNPALGGVMEWPLYPRGKAPIHLPDFADEHARAGAYPPNAFHTYWALQSLAAYRQTLPADAKSLSTDLIKAADTARAWAGSALATQTALISGGASRVDAQQLAYAIATEVQHSRETLTAGTQRHELLKAGLDAFFSTQDDDGEYPQSQPLFHYPASGNAYCYVFETLTELLRPALPRETGRVYRDLLRAHSGELIKSWHLARRTRVLLSSARSDDPRAPHYGWGSSHQAFRKDPEGWATAAVYSCLQALRCLLGHWVAEEAAVRVGATASRYATVAVGRETLAQRGRTWPTEPPWTLGRRLAALFLTSAGQPIPDRTW